MSGPGSEKDFEKTLLIATSFAESLGKVLDEHAARIDAQVVKNIMPLIMPNDFHQ
ncbi:hypothetical protein GCM10007291_37750 [Gemmobacter nanjingensis]|uniref:Uncharacterized protein n=1 Tax=Gemmobacter nanjingensis TaxID=488454 RepID=A0ABQ3FPZ9_9RHOB|nr:hypothetical protein GCM10007291_37750 [Gemmobacter nanjingensis]